ncbi:hypothetical protein [uncultured Robinsoniella sp.]|uniref:hypothetical protein n=1 Tax=uncultured Robinsoniella sp. TaxID=904190 RepID=UPI00374F9E2B
MRNYNYQEAVKNDVMDYIKNEIDFKDFDNIDELEEKLNDDLFTEDSVTGNGSGSYTFNTYEAEENLCHNIALLKEACEEFGSDIGELVQKGAESCDVTIRCYLLGQAITEAMKEVEYEFDEIYEEDEEA